MRHMMSSIRRPVRRLGGEKHLLITLLSFAASVSLTRLFLELTGYPQLGSGEIHIAHVLWGGLLLFIAALLPQLFANRWVYTLGALMTGTGAGLFIDEVGKFITSSNDYFHPLAAPIVYTFFLLTVLLYLQVRRPAPKGAREELYQALDALEEVLDHDLDQQEMRELEARLGYVSENTEHPEFARLANELLEFIQCGDLRLTTPRSTLWKRLSELWRSFEAQWFERNRLKAILIGGLLALGFVALVNMLRALPIGPSPTHFERIITRLITEGQVNSQGGITWYLLRIALETSAGVLLLTASGFLILGKDRLGIVFGHMSLLVSLTAINLLVFYFDQFSTILPSTIQFVLLLGITYYRQHYLPR
ncbi:MAG TPA: hypothetical protein ENI27_05140 [bacterium]|nr:hypothetical protein [bacterium]